MAVDIPAPEEPIPIADEDGWETETEEEVFVHGLGDEDAERRKRGGRFTTQVDYKTRLIEERKQWSDSEESLVLSYMNWRTSGSAEEVEGEDIDYFTCRMVSLTGKLLKLLIGLVF